jgi:hypothetical protein
MLTIGIICFFALLTCNDYIPQDEYESDSGSGSGDTTTTTPAPSKDVGGGGGGWAIFGGVLGGFSALAGLAVLGRRFCKKSKDLDYNY